MIPARILSQITILSIYRGTDVSVGEEKQSGKREKYEIRPKSRVLQFISAWFPPKRMGSGLVLEANLGYWFIYNTEGAFYSFINYPWHNTGQVIIIVLSAAGKSTGAFILQQV